MSKAIYTLKLSLLQHQFPDFPWQKKRKVEKMALFNILEINRSFLAQSN